jgi:hypothetical protein
MPASNIGGAIAAAASDDPTVRMIEGAARRTHSPIPRGRRWLA